MGAHSKPAARGRGILAGLLEWVVVIVAVVAAVQLVKAFVAEPYFVPTASMEPTIMPGDSVIAEKLSIRLSGGVERGDIVVFENPDPEEGHEILVKRVVATEGQTVDIVYGADGQGRVSVDGEVLDESYAVGSTEQLAADVAFPLTVPDGCVWLMGDNRENSADSRVFGPVDVDDVVGVVVFRYWPLGRVGAVE